ncbi:hypothetical protein VNO78_00865 [Psophocarpus tetragonolobus]|uniref:Uncharacterized protein n=1 Tax=Psophocarpus tetragonolobus TaxID=3891 RepID=A0AAN9XUC9_PSOTE
MLRSQVPPIPEFPRYFPISEFFNHDVSWFENLLWEINYPCLSWKMKGHKDDDGPLHMVFGKIFRHCRDVLDSLILVVTGDEHRILAPCVILFDK